VKRMIETPRLILRPFEAGNLDIIYQIYSDGEVLRYTPFDPVDRERARVLLDGMLDEWKKPVPGNREMAAIRKDTGEKLGRCHAGYDPETDSAMIGWFLKKEAWGNGFGTEIAKALIDYCFDELKVHRVWAVCNPVNPASWKIMEKCGMRREGFFRQKCRYVKGGKVSWEDELEYTILASDR